MKLPLMPPDVIRVAATRIVLSCSLAMLAACGGGGGGSRSPAPAPAPQAGTLQLSAAALTLDETAGVAELRITRSGGSDGAVSVRVASSNGSASAGQDYAPLDATVSFANGDTSEKILTVPITDDADAESDETLQVALSAPAGGATLGAIAAATLTIADDDPPSAPVLSVTGQLKQFVFTWASVSGATTYSLLRSPDGIAPFVQLGPTHAAGQTSVLLNMAVHRQDWLNARYRLDACNDTRCRASASVSVGALQPDTIGYFKASNTDAGDFFGKAIALSADDSTLAVGAAGEDSAAVGHDGDGQEDNGATEAGAVYVFSRAGASWAQQAYLKASNTEAEDSFGWAVAASSDGNTLAVAAFGEDSAATGTDGDGQGDNTANSAGAVYVFSRSGASWSQQAYLKASNTEKIDLFGSALALSADGDTLAVSALGEDSEATGTDGDGQDDNTAEAAGAVYIFTRSGATWSQQAYVKASNTDAQDLFGSSVALSADGNSLAVGAPFESSNATGAGGDGQDDDSAARAGAAYVFVRSGQQWSQQAYLKASNSEPGDEFGSALGLNGAGDILAVGAPVEDSGAGAVYVFARSPTQQWSQEAYLKASNAGPGDNFGWAVALSTDGSTVAASALDEDGDLTGVGAADELDRAHGSGAVYVFDRSATAQWSQLAYVKASNTDAQDQFGHSLALSGNGHTLAVGATEEDSAATSVDSGSNKDNTALEAGAVYLY